MNHLTKALLAGSALAVVLACTNSPTLAQPSPPSGGSGVTTFNVRTGDVVPQAGDYATILETLMNKTINGPDNTITNIANASLANSGMTIAGKAISLGGSITLASTDLSNSTSVVLTTAAQALTNKSLDFSLNTATKIPLSAFTNLGTTTTLLHGNAAGSPTFSAVSLSADVTGNLPLTNLATIANHTHLGNVSGGTAVPVALTQAQLTADLNLFTTSLQGVVPASGGGTTNFLRADGTWAAPAGGGGSVSLTCGNGLVCAPNPITGTGTISPTTTISAKTGNYAILSTDGGSLVSSTSGSAIADTIVNSATAGYGLGFGFDLHNLGLGATTLTAGSPSLFDNGQSALVISTGQDAFVWGDGTNYHAIMSQPVIANNTVMGNISGHGEYPVSLTQAQLTALVNNFTSLLAGSVPASGGGTSNFLRADGTWAAVGGSGTVNSGTTPGVAYYAGSGAAVSDGGSSVVNIGGINVTSATTTGLTNGMYLSSANVIQLRVASTNKLQISSGGAIFVNAMAASNAAGASILDAAASATVPTVLPNKGSSTGGIGANASGNVSLISGSAEKVRVDTNGMSMQAGVFTLKGFTFSTLPASPATGSMAYITDQTAACSYGAVPVGSGSNVCKVWYNGTGWIDG